MRSKVRRGWGGGCKEVLGQSTIHSSGSCVFQHKSSLSQPPPSHCFFTTRKKIENYTLALWFNKVLLGVLNGQAFYTDFFRRKLRKLSLYINPLLPLSLNLLKNGEIKKENRSQRFSKKNYINSSSIQIKHVDDEFDGYR